MKKKVFRFCILILSLLVLPISAKAATINTGSPADIVGPLIQWAFGFIGMAMILFGAYQMALNFAKGEAMSNAKALMIALAGALVVVAVTQWEKIFGSGAVTTPTAPTVISNSDASDIFMSFAPWVPTLGYIVLFWGAIKMYMGFKDDSPGDKIKGVTMVVAGAALSQLIRIMNDILKWNPS